MLLHIYRFPGIRVLRLSLLTLQKGLLEKSFYQIRDNDVIQPKEYSSYDADTVYDDGLNILIFERVNRHLYATAYDESRDHGIAKFDY